MELVVKASWIAGWSQILLIVSACLNTSSGLIGTRVPCPPLVSDLSHMVKRSLIVSPKFLSAKKVLFVAVFDVLLQCQSCGNDIGGNVCPALLLIFISKSCLIGFFGRDH